MFDYTDVAAAYGDLVTVYALWPRITLYDAGESIKQQGIQYDSLLALLHQRIGDKDKDKGAYIQQFNQYRTDEIIVFDARFYRDWTGYDFASGGPAPERGFDMYTAVSAHPLRTAMSELRTVYIVTFLIAVLGTLILRRIIKLNLTQPLEAVNDGIAGDWKRIARPDDSPQKWREPRELYGRYEKTRDKLLWNKNELTRLNTALDYAKQAEQNRRQMTSNIAHELKTPLAIIHSYSEGLKEHSAEDKREHYLDVIVAESERMDAMVLEMLDLSRLEAGKVKLARDEFSLAGLVRSVLDKLDIAANEKALAVTYDAEGDCTVHADEARISQVVTNFAENAIKYSPHGGSITVRVRAQRNAAEFSIENESEKLTNDELSKVWETFYRTDAARSGDGTGLGLAIAKSIVDLHGGKCFVRNTETGVVFGFAI
jgi:signal transduction histidine kinase